MQNNLSDHRRKKKIKKERKKGRKKRNNEIKIILRTLKCIEYNKMDELVLLY
jgi:hypothetical protein